MSFESAGNRSSAVHSGDFAPLDLLERSFRYGWLVILLTVVGGLAGWVVHQIRLPLYEARFGITVSYDLTNMGEMTQYEQDFVSGAVGDLVYASDVLEMVAAQARERGISITPAELKEIAARERQAQTWYVRVRHTDPDKAVLLAGLWGQVADRVLWQAFQEGVKAQGLQRYLDALEDCLQRTALVDPVLQECSASNLPVIQKELAATGQALVAARMASRGILPSLALNWSEKPIRPDRPVLLGLGQVVLAGSGCGFLLAVILIETGLVDRRRRRLV